MCCPGCFSSGLFFWSDMCVVLEAFGFLVDAATGKGMGWSPREIAVGCFGVFVVGAAASFGQTALLKVAGERMMRRLRVQLFGSMLRQPIAFHDQNSPGTLVSRLSTDTYMAANAISDNVSVGVRRLFDASGALALMVYTSPVLTVTSVAVVPVFFLSSLFGRWAKRQTKMQLERLSESSHIAEERLSGIRTVRAFSMEEREEGRYLEKLNDLYKTAVRLAFGTAGIYGATTLAMNASFLVVLFQGTHLVEAVSVSCFGFICHPFSHPNEPGLNDGWRADFVSHVLGLSWVLHDGHSQVLHGVDEGCGFERARIGDYRASSRHPSTP